ncbi:MAG: hypothetical protein QOH12_3386 [Solirubrobacteraceae bacterium]|jgi:hypothetical protein|nr:hypothetical protein [Solirubrobacteraceae bacterium]
MQRTQQRRGLLACLLVLLGITLPAAPAPATPPAPAAPAPRAPAPRAPAPQAPAPQAHAADTSYGPLSRVAASATRATLQGRDLTVQITLKKTAGVRLSVVQGESIRGYAKRLLKPGRYLFKGRLSSTPTGSGLQLRVTVRLVSGRRGRQRYPLKIVAPAPPGGPTIVPPNHPPTGISLSATTIPENQPSGTRVGTLTDTDQDTADAPTYTLVAGTGSADNASFTITGTTLKTAASFDLETKSTYAIRVRVEDGHGGTFEKAFTIAVTNVDEPPTLTAGASVSYTENDPPTQIDPALTVADPDSARLTGATVAITANHSAGQDRLALPAQPTITATFDDAGGVLTLTGTDTLAAYQAALRAVTYENSSDNPDGAARTFTLLARDATGFGPAASSTISVTPVNDPPALTTTSGSLSFTEGAAATAVDAGLGLTDPDSQIASATVTISGNFAGPEDALALPAPPVPPVPPAPPAPITAVYDATTGTLTLTGTADAAAYQAALRSVTYRDSSNNPSTAPRTLTFKATDSPGAQSPPAQRTVDVGATDTPPTLVNSAGSLAYTENDSPAPIDSGLTVTDPDSTDLAGATVQITGNHAAGEDVLGLPAQPTITATFDAATGSLTLTGTDTLAHYQAALRAVTYANTSDNPSTATRTATFTARDAGGSGAPDTHTITIAAVDDPPVAVDDSAFTTEDPTTPLSIPVLANDTDVDGGAHTLTGFTQPAHGVVIDDGGGVLLYTPPANFCNSQPGGVPDTFGYTLNGGSTTTVSVKVVCVDDPPVAVDDAATVVEDSGATQVDVLANDTDIDGGPKSIQAVTQPANGTVAITGPGPGPGTALTYTPNPNYCNSPPATAPDTFTYTLNSDPTPAPSATGTVSITVTCVDDPPVAVNDSASTTEDPVNPVSIPVLANDTDVDGGAKTLASFTQPANGTVIDGGGGVLLYAPLANYCNSQPTGTPDTFGYTLNGGSTATVSVDVSCVPDAPTVTTTPATLTYTENDPATPVDPGLTVTDPDPAAAVTGATVKITANYAAAEDVLALSGGSHPGITPSLSGDTLTLSGTATDAAYEAALRDVTYANTSETPSPAARTVTFTLTDETALSGSASRNIAVVPVDDPPVAVDDAATVLEQAAATAVPVLANDTDVDGGLESIQTVTQPAKGTVTITGAGSGLTYKPDANYCNDSPGAPPTTPPTPATFTYTLNGGSSATVSMTVTCVNQAPAPGDDTFSATSSAIGNTALIVNAPGDPAPTVSGPSKTVNANILANDSDPDGPNPLAVVPGTFATNDGGSVTIQSDGDFVFTPAPATSCTDHSDFFDYTVTDANPGTPGTAVARVTIQITGCVWYVNNNAPGNSGTSTAPFDTLAQAQTASAAADTIFVEAGDGTSAGLSAGIALKDNQQLIGEAAALQVGPDVLQAAVPANRPTITNSNADVVGLASGNTVRGVQLDPAGSGNGIAGGAGDTGGTIDDVRIIDSGTPSSQAELALAGTSGTFDISDLSVDAAGSAVGVRLNSNSGVVNFKSAGTIAIASSGGRALDASATNMGAGSVFDALTVTASASGALSMVNTSGTTTFGGLDLHTTSGATAAFLLQNAGSVTVPATGTADVTAAGGPAVDVSATSGPSLAFDNVSSSSSSASGISLSGLGTGTFSATGGTISQASGTAVAITGGSGAITYAGQVNDGPGASALVSGRTGGTVTLSGTIADGADAGGGIAITGNSGGSTVLSGASKTLNTAGAPAIAMTSDTGHTVTISGGGLAIATAGGSGLSADSGTLNVTGSGNSIATATGGALLLDNTTIGASDLTFQSISANGASNAIRLSHTRTSGRLVVTGNGGTCTNADTTGCSGGTIANASGGDDASATPTGTGIVLNDTLNPSFTRIRIHDASNYAIRGTTVSGLTLANSVINGANGTNGTTPIDDSSVWFDNLTGSASVTGTHVSGGFEDNFRVVNTSGSLNRITFASDTIGDNSAAGGNDGILLESSSTAGQLQATVQSSTFTGAGGDLLQYDHNGSGSGDLVLTGNAFSNNHPGIATGGGGLTLANGGTSGPTTIAITGANTFRDAVGNALTIVKSTGPSTQTGTFSGNTIGVAGNTTLGSSGGDGLKLQTVGQGTLTWNVASNQIYGFANFGVDVLAGGGATAQSGTVNVTVTGNTIANPAAIGGFPTNGLQFNIGTVSTPAPGDTYNACLQIGGPGALANTVNATGTNGAPDIRPRQRQGTTIRLPGYGGSATDDAAVDAFVAGNNKTNPVVLASHNSTGFTGAGTTCP